MDAPADDAGGPPPIRTRDVVVFGLALVGGVAALVLGLAFLSPWLLKAALGLTSERATALALYTALVMTLIYLYSGVAVHWLVLRPQGRSWGTVGLRGCGMRWLLLGVAAALVIGPMVEGLDRLLGGEASEGFVRHVTPHGLTPASTLILLPVVGLLAPVAEELVFRGVLYTWIRGRWGVIAAVLVTSALFGLAHMQAQWALVILPMGVVLALLYEASGSLLPSIAMHATNNLLSLVWLYVTLPSDEARLAIIFST